MNGLGILIEKKFDVVDEPQQQARKFVMQVGFALFDQLGPWEATDDCLQDGFRI